MDRPFPCAGEETHAAGRWLAQMGRVGPGRLPALALAAADAAPAIAFALGLAFSVAAVPKGAAAMAPWLCLVFGAALARGLISREADWSAACWADRVKRGVRLELARAAFLERPGERAPVGETMADVVDGVATLDGWFGRYAPARFAAATGPVMILAAMAVASPIAAFVGVATFIPFIAAMILAGGGAASEARRQLDALRRLSGLFADRVRALPAILAFQAEIPVAMALELSAVELARRTLKVLKIAFLSTAVLEFFAALSVALIAVYCGFNLLRLLPFPVPERLDLARAVFVLALAPEVYAPLRRLAGAYHERQAAEAWAVRAMARGESPIRSVPPADMTAAPSLRFRDVTVTYPSSDRPALDGFDLAVRAGEVIALTGPTGSGKSTILHLLLGLASASGGEVEADGVPIDPDRGLSAGAAWAGQATVVVPGALADNIALARPAATPAEIARVAAKAGLDLAPGGLDRRLDERGGGLSGGERRRLGLARALLRDAPLLLLDEPTANLDAASEAALLPVIAAAARGRTTLIATHSDAVAALADRVVTLAA